MCDTELMAQTVCVIVSGTRIGCKRLWETATGRKSISSGRASYSPRLIGGRRSGCPAHRRQSGVVSSSEHDGRSFGCAQIACVGSRASSVARGRPEFRAPRDGRASPVRCRARGLRADSSSGGRESKTDRSAGCPFGVKSATAAWRALVIRSHIGRM
jgi:hypothetical protein